MVLIELLLQLFELLDAVAFGGADVLVASAVLDVAEFARAEPFGDDALA